jgi:hypothetical protein
MDPLDSTTILVQAVEPALPPSPVSRAGVRRAELGKAEALGGARTRRLTEGTERAIKLSNVSALTKPVG